MNEEIISNICNNHTCYHNKFNQLDFFKCNEDRMPIFLLIMTLLLSQHIFCSNNKIAQNYRRHSFTNLSIEQALRGHDDLKHLPLDQTPYFPTKEDIKLATERKRTKTLTLNGSTDKINNNK